MLQENLRKRFSLEYPQYESKKSTITDDYNEVMLKIKEVIIGICLAGVVISRKMVTPIETRALKANNPNLLSEFEKYVVLTDMWIRGVLKSIGWIKRKGTTGRVEPSKKLLAEEKFTFQMT